MILLVMKKFKRLFFILLAFLTITPIADRLTEYAQNPADLYLDIAVEKARNAFLTLTAMKSVLAIVEGSDVETGVRFGVLGQSADVTLDIEAGDFAEPTYDLVDKAWNITLISWIAIEVERMLLHFSDLKFANMLLFFGFLGLFYASSKKKKTKKIDVYKISIFILIFGIALKFLFPATVLTSQKISNTLTEGSLLSSQEVLDTKVQELNGLSEVYNSTADPIEKYNQISTWFKSHDASFWQEYSSQIVKHTMLLAAIFLLDAIILPIASLLFIWNLLKRFFSWLLDFSVLLN
tara:strand:+ start:286 stop:1164 length:879 start_codon:yes stop_codon:yes gene_type:complete